MAIKCPVLIHSLDFVGFDSPEIIRSYPSTAQEVPKTWRIFQNLWNFQGKNQPGAGIPKCLMCFPYSKLFKEKAKVRNSAQLPE